MGFKSHEDIRKISTMADQVLVAWRGTQYTFILLTVTICGPYIVYTCSMFSPCVTYSVRKHYCKLFIEGQLGPALFSVSFLDPIYNISPHSMWYTWQQIACPVWTFLNDLQSKLYLPWTGSCNWYLQSMIPLLGVRYMYSINLSNPTRNNLCGQSYCWNPCKKYQHVSEYYYLPV